MWSEQRGRVRLGVVTATVLALFPACGGKSTQNEANAEGGGANQAEGGSAGLVAAGGAAGSASGTAGATSGSAGSGSGAAGTTSSGTTGGASTSCLLPSGELPAEARKCLTDSDCATFTINTCCSEDRVLGVAKYPDCTLTPTPCDGNDGCIKPEGFVVDDGTKTSSRDELRVTCQFNAPGAGQCRTLIANDFVAVCGAISCKPNEVCVHLSPRGGPAPRCFPLPSDGLCPADSEYTADCDGAPACRELLLTPQPYCAAIPPSCRVPLHCSCLPADYCRAPQVCMNVVRRDVFCQDLSP